MLSFITDIPTDKRIGGVHCVPILSNGNLMMAWDREEQVLTTIGGRLEKNESIIDGLNREVMEEAGLELTSDRTIFASWYWKEYDAYTLYFLAKVKNIVELPKGFEKTGYIITNFETAIELIRKIEGREERIEIIRRAGLLTGQLNDSSY